MSDVARPRVLNVNDREIPRYVAERTLSQAGYDVVSVATGAAALDAATSADLVLLDVQLPDLDGFAICRRLKAKAETGRIPVLLTSATFVTAENKVLGLDAGADAYLAQPYESTELLATLRALLRTRAAERRAQALTEEIREAMRVRDDFLAMLGHELRNPIGVIQTAMHLLRDSRSPEKFNRYTSMIERQTKNLGRIVDDLLDVARIKRGRVQLSKVPVSLAELVERSVAALAGEASASSLDLTLHAPTAPAVILGDAVRLEQIISNLLTNAIKYTPRGGRIDVRVGEVDGQAVVTVADDGIGLDERTRARVFDLFVQGEQGLERSRGGLGLGLTVVRELVDLHGGRVEAASEGPGRGSVFTVRVPLFRGELAPVAPPEPPPTPQKTVRVLVIEDNDDARAALREALGAMQHSVEVAADGERGVECALRTSPDVVLVDIGLPHVDGYEVARRIRSQSGDGGPHLIAMTGYGQPADRARALAAGFERHLVKPIAVDELARILAQIV